MACYNGTIIPNFMEALGLTNIREHSSGSNGYIYLFWSFEDAMNCYRRYKDILLTMEFSLHEVRINGGDICHVYSSGKELCFIDTHVPGDLLDEYGAKGIVVVSLNSTTTG